MCLLWRDFPTITWGLLFRSARHGEVDVAAGRYLDSAWIDICWMRRTERNYHPSPERLTEFLKARAGRRTVAIDEIQRVPDLLRMIHRHIEFDKSRRFVRFVLTGCISTRGGSPATLRTNDGTSHRTWRRRAGAGGRR